MVTMRRLLALLLVSTPVSAQEAISRERFEFRGLHLADSVTRDVERQQKLRCQQRDGAPKGGRFCFRFGDDVAGVPATTVLDLVDDKIARISFTFETAQFASLSSAFVARWGKATDTKTEEVQNRMGAKFENITHFWNFADGLLELERYSSKVTEGRASIQHTALLMKELEREQCAKAKAAQKDFGGKLPEGCTP